MKLRNNYQGRLLISVPFPLTPSALFCLELARRGRGNQQVRTQVQIKCHIELGVRWIEEMYLGGVWRRDTMEPKAYI